ncbi:two-component system response regulator YesN [Paenibacillus sp. V4I9]|uniref:response regulator n=1 Tax=Paenibacillus sp. V4I9 TaxID=3042308 RepID=UPI00278A8DB1|nr:response regulator [Paenibacillus sp. V4I9]MDQ0886754.1 two-component system response regulator YesN [Paenibacillus sp. V4I9]
MNFKVLVLDDEPKQRKGIIAKMNISGLPITIVGEAGDGIEGLELALRVQPDIVITDIRMPGMDGLDFIERAKELNPEIVFVIISGYSDFDFAKRAIKYGVSDYLLKPIDEAELRSNLANIILKIEETRKSRLEMEKLKQDKEMNLESLRQQLLTRMVQEPKQSASSQESITTVSDLIERFPYILAIVLVLEPYQLPHYSFRTGDEDLIRFAIENMMSDQMKLAGRDGVIFQHAIHQNEMVYILGVENLNENTAVKEWLTGVLFGVNHYMRLEVTIAIGSIVDSLDKMQKSYQLAKLSLRNKIISGTNKIYDYGWIQSHSNSREQFMKEKDEELLFSLLNEGNETALHRWIAHRIQSLVDFPTATYSQLEWFCADMYLLLRKYLLEKTEDTKLVIGEMDDLHYWLQNLTSWREAVQQIQSQVTNIIHFLNKDHPVKDVMDEIKQYLVMNLHENISLQSIADRFFIHPTYFSKRFIDKYGQGYSDFLTQQRMEKAAEWLRETNMKVQEIAEMVGFEGAAYFSSVFKKSHGLSPKEYRQNHRQTM